MLYCSHKNTWYLSVSRRTASKQLAPPPSRVAWRVMSGSTVVYFTPRQSARSFKKRNSRAKHKAQKSCPQLHNRFRLYFGGEMTQVLGFPSKIPKALPAFWSSCALLQLGIRIHGYPLRYIYVAAASPNLLSSPSKRLCK